MLLQCLDHGEAIQSKEHKLIEVSLYETFKT